MERMIYLYPVSQTQYRYFLQEVGPKLDDAGLSFHICRPGENIIGSILQKEVNE